MSSQFSALSYIDSLGVSGMKFDLGRMRGLMRFLGDPQDRFPSIHIAGTNGKGSVAAMIASVLNERGIRVGLYTSPHLEHLRERFQINQQLISMSDLERLTRRLRRALKSPSLPIHNLTQFEFLTAIAFLWFAENHIEAAVIETGLGGRLDATNVMTKKILTVITNIGLDHTDWLGTTKRQIAVEKAGIIRAAVPIVTGASGGALEEIRRVAKKRGAPFVAVQRGVNDLEDYEISLKGEFQKDNRAVALRAIEILAPLFGLGKTEIRRGIARTFWPGRYESFFIGRNKNRIRVILDGAHNPAAMRALAFSLKREKMSGLRLLFGALRDKDINSMVKILAPLCREIYTVPVGSSRTASSPDLAGNKGWRGRAVPCDSVKAGWRKVLSRGHSPILVTGSLYLIGAVRPLVRNLARRGS